MKEYIVRRLGLLIPTVLGVSIIVFLMMHFIPGDLVALLLGDYYTEETAAAIRQQYGLDRPLYVQYAFWFGAPGYRQLGPLHHCQPADFQ
jgi:peptide/nickel transport system permease protein